MLLRFKTFGIIWDCELRMLGRVFDKSKPEGETSAEADARAWRIMTLFMSGFTDEVQLIEMARPPLGR